MLKNELPKKKKRKEKSATKALNIEYKIFETS